MSLSSNAASLRKSNGWMQMALALLGAGAVVIVFALWFAASKVYAPWSESELELLKSLWIATLPGPPVDPTNAVSADQRAAELGHRLFFDERLSANGQVSCATCHQPARSFTDGLPRSQAVGRSLRNAPSLIGVAYSPWLYWDGRKDSLWSQALSPLEDPNEHAGDRAQYSGLIASDPSYRRDYEALFGPLPSSLDDQHVDQIFANIGKAMGAYERLLAPTPSRFDAYVEAVAKDDRSNQRQVLTTAEMLGLRLFIGKANCTQCHNGPLLTNNAFHNTGVLSAPGLVPDRGRRLGVTQARRDPFNCLGSFSDAPEACAELQFARDSAELVGAFRTPSLRNLRGTEPYMHAGQIQTLAEVISHYDNAEVAMIGHNEAKPLNLWPWERSNLEAFLLTLRPSRRTAAAADSWWLRPPDQSQSP